MSIENWNNLKLIEQSEEDKKRYGWGSCQYQDYYEDFHKYRDRRLKGEEPEEILDSILDEQYDLQWDANMKVSDLTISFEDIKAEEIQDYKDNYLEEDDEDTEQGLKQIEAAQNLDDVVRFWRDNVGDLWSAGMALTSFFRYKGEITRVLNDWDEEQTGLAFAIAVENGWITDENVITDFPT